MNATIQKWGNSLAVRLPKALADQARLGEGAQVEIVPTDDGLLVKRHSGRRYRLSELVKGINPANVHSETTWGP